MLLQWNSHGYDIAKMFARKFTHISPVWLQLTRRYIFVVLCKCWHHTASITVWFYSGMELDWLWKEHMT